MSWLRTDDGFTSHPKFAGWTGAQKWAFLELMHYCARYKTDGKIPPDISLLPRGVTRGLLALAERSGWIDRNPENHLFIHDWGIYNPKDATAASRMKAYRERNETRNTDRNETVPRAQARAEPVPSRPLKEQTPPTHRLPEDSNDEPAGGRAGLNEYGRTPDEQAHIDKVDAWFDDSVLPPARRNGTDTVEIPALDPLKELP